MSSGVVFRVRVEPGGHTFDVPVGETVLAAALAAGVPLPSSCRNGTCRACRCLATAGQVTYRIAWPGLSAEEKHEGWVLPCVAMPATDLTLHQPLPGDAAVSAP